MAGPDLINLPALAQLSQLEGLTRLKSAETAGFGQKVSTTRGLGEVRAGLRR